MVNLKNQIFQSDKKLNVTLTSLDNLTFTRKDDNKVDLKTMK